jgi:hypothetical protein
MMKRHIIFSLALMLLPLMSSQADDFLQLLTTIPVARDSSHIANVAPIGDFNNDGFPDMAVAVRQGWPHVYEAVRLYWGGPDFDSIPDLILGAEANVYPPPDPGNAATLFGYQICGMGDFNGDGFNDLAISAPNKCDSMLHNGRIYIYFGSTYPDTLPDLIIVGRQEGVYFGNSLVPGDYNGDGLGDILTATHGDWYGARVCIYLGANPPDSACDWLYDYLYQPVIIPDAFGGRDINGDGYSDFSWFYNVGNTSIDLLFLGNQSLGQIAPPDTIFSAYILYPGDISGDGADDFIISHFNETPYLYLGGSSFDLNPDYSLGYGLRYLAPGKLESYSAEGSQKMLYNRTSYGYHRLDLYNIGTPPDTIPCATFDYSTNDWVPRLNIGDINADGIDEIAFEDTALTQVFIYGIHSTGIDDEPGDLPNEFGQLTAYPNPFNSSTIISISDMNKAEISISDITGRQVASLHARQRRAVWDASGFSSGVYFARVKNGEKAQSIKLILLK